MTRRYFSQLSGSKSGCIKLKKRLILSLKAALMTRLEDKDARGTGEGKAITMKRTTHAGMTGKSFYAALSLSVAMVGAACWYAWSESDKLSRRAVPEQSRSEPAFPQSTVPQTAPPPPQTTVPVPAAQPAGTVPAATEAAEEAAAILRRTEPALPAETAPPPAETEPAELLPMMPVSGEILQRFSQGELVKSETTGIWSTHNGNDYAVPLGTEVLCTEDGTVAAVGRDTLWGVCVTVLHADGTETRYCGLNENLNVQAGDVIPRGTVLGTVGATNEAESALAPHLHFEVRRNDRYLDPESYFASGNPAGNT